jgi:hypothetical protein
VYNNTTFNNSEGTLSRDFRPQVFLNQTTIAEIFDFEIVVSGVNDTVDRWWAVSMTPRTSGGQYQ